ncbi:MAG: SusC/RagA family TonB-linked outer membrane protein [Capnocytophaga sp.]|nr:SusC/RagA family TonB-linked outer membrane protein [Capnocytophaga sp.]
MKLRLTCMVVLFFAVLHFSFAQEKTITGTVKDDLGLPLPGVTVQVKGESAGTQTDFDGNYSLKVAVGKTLVFSYVGMATTERKVGTANRIDIAMAEDAQQLAEVVVTGITTTDRRLFTGASDRLVAADVKLDGIPDVSRALEGRSAGVTVQNVSGTFGAAPKIRVRGATSIYGASKPLWVVDGVILEDVIELGPEDLSSGDATTLISSAIAGLNPDDIENFEVLKDGSATSIYGARAMAGVIVITTKRGKAGVSTFNYTNESTFRLIPSYADFNIMNSQEQMSVYEEMRTAGWLNYADVANRSASGVYGRMYQLLNQLDSNGNFMLANTAEAKSAYLRQAELRNTNWFNLLFNPTIMQNHSISMSSGNDKSAYYASISAMIDPGWTLSSKTNRFTGNFNSSFKLSDKLTYSLLTNASYRKQKAPGTLARNVDVVSGEIKRDFDINPYSYALNTSRTLDPDEMYVRSYAPFNIVNELANNYMDLEIVDLRLQNDIKWKFSPKVEFMVLGALKYQNTNQDHHIKENSNQANSYRAMQTSTIRDRNPFLFTDVNDPYGLPFSILPQGGIYQRTNYNMISYDFRATVAYKDVINEDHTVNAYGGFESNTTNRNRNRFRGWGMQYDMGEIPFYIYEAFVREVQDNDLYYSVENTKYRNLAFFGNATYSWKRRYTVNGTYRYEGTNKLGRSRSARWLPTWNISGAWNVHEEDFFDKLSPKISHLTLKGSYSLTADRGPASVTNSLVDIRSSSPWKPFAGVRETALYINSLENSELTYEKKKELNIGVDIGFFNERIALAADWYTRNNYDLIGVTTTQGLGGEIQKYGNVAEMKSNGFELSINTVNIKKDDFSWKTNFIYSKIKNEVTRLDNYSRVIDLITGDGFAREGYPVRSLFSIPFRGLTNDGLPTFLDQDGNVTSTGIYFQERNNIDFLEYSGSIDPTDVGSLGNIFQYKGLKLNIFVTYSFGNVVRLNPIFSSSYTDLTAMPREFKNRWVVPGDENYTTIPVIATSRMTTSNGNLNRAYNAYNYSTERVAKGDFIRMKEISLTYDFDKDILEKLDVRNLSLKLQATNLFLIYADKKLNGQDPEFFNSGGVAVPLPKQLTFTLRVGL